MYILLLPLLSYLVGSIPTGYWFCRFFFSLDITQYGSGNIGASNVARVLGSKKYFLLIFFIDAFKAWITLYGVHQMLAPIYSVWAILACAAALMLGNSHSIFMRFKGGKGVATLCGIVAYLIPLKFLLVFIISWLIIAALTRQIFLASLSATGVMMLTYGMFGTNQPDTYFYCLLAMFAWITLRHKQNMIHFFKSC